jgi:hypothetical protein
MPATERKKNPNTSAAIALVPKDSPRMCGTMWARLIWRSCTRAKLSKEAVDRIESSWRVAHVGTLNAR